MLNRRRAVAVVLLGIFAALPAAAATLEGRWALVEETYGAGGLDLTRNKPRVTIEFVRESGSLVGRIRLAPEAVAERWPISGPADRPVVAKDVELRIAPQEDGVRARYLTPENEDRFRLDVVEEYRVSDDGAFLIGTMTVTFLREGETRGSFVLHRRFQRQS